MTSPTSTSYAASRTSTAPTSPPHCRRLPRTAESPSDRYLRRWPGTPRSARPATAPGSNGETSPTASRASSPSCSTASSSSPTHRSPATPTAAPGTTPRSRGPEPCSRGCSHLLTDLGFRRYRMLRAGHATAHGVAAATARTLAASSDDVLQTPERSGGGPSGRAALAGRTVWRPATPAFPDPGGRTARLAARRGRVRGADRSGGGSCCMRSSHRIRWR